MTTLTNANGSTYFVEAKMEAGLDNVYLLSYYGQEGNAIQNGAGPEQYIVARGWSEKTKSWDNGSYFLVWNGNYTEALKDAEECFKDHVECIFYYM